MHCHQKMCFTLAPASEWKEDTIEWIARHAHSDVKQYAAQKKTAFERGSYVSDVLQKRGHLFLKDRPADIIWYQEVAFVFA